jgi:chromosomal replication initiation ATPase DnaA
VSAVLAPPPAQLPLPFGPVRRAFAAPVIEAGSNAAARAWLARTAEWPQLRLALWGPPGCGKSRLLGAWARRQGGETVAGARLRLVPPQGPLAIDDADRAPPLALLHTLNAALEAGHAVLLAAAAAPARWAVALPDLASRLRAITAVAIEAPEDDLLHALLARLLAERQLRPSAATLSWLLARLPRTHAAMAEAVERLDRAAQAQGVPIAPALARQVLADLLADLPEPAEPGGGDEDSVSRSPMAAGLL